MSEQELAKWANKYKLWEKLNPTKIQTMKGYEYCEWCAHQPDCPDMVLCRLDSHDNELQYGLWREYQAAERMVFCYEWIKHV